MTTELVIVFWVVLLSVAYTSWHQEQYIMLDGWQSIVYAKNISLS